VASNTKTARSTVRVSANAAALALSDQLERPLTAKQVRDMARDVLPEHDKTTHPAYTGHAYDAAQLRKLAEAFAARGSRGRGGANDASAARAMLAPKAAPKPRAAKATSVQAVPDATE